MSSPDLISAGFIDAAPAALRYGDENATADPIEVFGLMKAMMPSGVRVLDVGCGAGAGTLAINEGKGNHVVGIEPDAERAEAARRRGLDCRTALFDAASTASLGLFDVIVFADVLEHLADPASALRLARALLSAGGSVLISVPNVAHWSIRAKLMAGRFDYQADGLMDATHLRWFTFRSMRHMLERCGFVLRDKTGSAGAWLPYYGLVPGRRHIVSALRKAFPGIFSCQLVVRATVACAQFNEG